MKFSQVYKTVARFSESNLATLTFITVTFLSFDAPTHVLRAGRDSEEQSANAWCFRLLLVNLRGSFYH